MADENLTKAIRQIRGQGTNRPCIKSFFDEASFTYSYVVYDDVAKKAAIIDSVLDYDAASGRLHYQSAEALLDFIKSNGLQLEWLLETHAHADHLSAAPYLQNKLGGKITIGEHITTVQQTFGKLFNAGTEFQRDGSDFDRLWKDGDEFTIGSINVSVLHVPGHTPACIAYVVGDVVFVGDTMFMPDYGTARADFPGGDARQLFQSAKRILALPPQTKLYMCHDYLPSGRNIYQCETSVEAERSMNIHIHDGITEEEFVAMRTKRDAGLAMPRLIMPSVQVNMRAGHFPPAEDNGLVYLKIPVNAV